MHRTVHTLLAIAIGLLVAGCGGEPTTAAPTMPSAGTVAPIAETPATTETVGTAVAPGTSIAPGTSVAPGGVTPPPASPTAVASAPAETHKPALQLLTPADGATVSVGQDVDVTAVAADDAGVDRIELWVDNAKADSAAAEAGQTVLQTTLAWTATTAGTHALTVIAYDNAGTASDPVSRGVTVVANQAPPQVAIYSPSSGATIEAGDEVQVQSTASDEAGVTRIELWVDGTMVTYAASPDASGQSPFSVTQAWQTHDVGGHSLVARAYDSAGRTTDSAAVQVSVQNTQPPAVSIDLDASSVTAGAKVTAHVNAVDRHGVNRVELWVDGVLSTGTNSASADGHTSVSVDMPWWSTTPGLHRLKARVYDTLGAWADSQEVPVTVVLPQTPTEPPPPTDAPTQPPPAPTATPVPPQPPSVEIADPLPGFIQDQSTPLPFTIEVTSSAPLSRVELWGTYAGQSAAQLLQSQTVGGTDQTVEMTWTPTVAGAVTYFARAYDTAGGQADSDPVGGTIDTPDLPTPTAGPTPAPM